MVANAAIASSGFRIQPGCEQNLMMTLTDAEGKLASAPERRAEAVANTLRLIAAMIDEASQQGTDELHEWSLGRALGKLCPLFPFC
jgi:hypothetical protein